MIFKVQDDWKRNLNAKDEAQMNEILRQTAKHRTAYRSAHDVKVAQLWAAVLELSKMLNERTQQRDELEKRLSKIEAIFHTASESIKAEETQKASLKDSLKTY
ncbi:MAG TPA: hypothetical protein VI968_01945 [archaeon]|nr:hypothetical protein [archaeon]